MLGIAPDSPASGARFVGCALDFTAVFFARLVHSTGSSVTRLGDFLKFLATKFLAREAQMIGIFLGNFEKLNSYVPKICFGLFFGTFGKIWARFYSSIWSH